MHCPKGVHKSPQTSSGAAEVHRHKVTDLHGRYVTDGQLKATNLRADLHSSVSPGETRICHQQQKICAHSLPANGVLRMTVDSQSMVLKLPGKKIKESRAEARHLLANPSIQARSLAQFLGKLNATSPALQMVPLFCRSLQLSIRQSLAANSQDYQSPVKLSPQAVEDPQWWEQHLISWNRRSFISPASIIVIHSSLQGWGATCKGNRPEVLGPPRNRLFTSTAWKYRQLH